MSSTLTSLLEAKEYHAIWDLATKGNPRDFGDNDLMAIAEAMLHLNRTKEAGQAYLVVLSRCGERAVEATTALLSQRLISYNSPVLSELKRCTVDGVKASSLKWTEALLRHVINIDLNFYESVLWEYLKLPGSKSTFAIKLMIYGGTNHLPKYKNQTPTCQLLDMAAAYSNGNYNEVLTIMKKFDPNVLCDGELEEFLVVAASTHFALGEYQKVIQVASRDDIPRSAKKRLSILVANAEFARGNHASAHHLRWENQTASPREHIGIRNINENAFLRRREPTCSVTLLADEGLGDTVYYLSKYAKQLGSPRFPELAVEENHFRLISQLVNDLGINLKLVKKSQIIQSILDQNLYQNPIAFLSNLPYLLPEIKVEWFSQPGFRVKATAASNRGGREHSKLRVVVSCTTSRQRNRAEREVDIQELLEVLLYRNQCEVTILDEDSTVGPNTPVSAIRRLPKSPNTHPELAYLAIASADVYVGICNTYIYIAGTLGIPAFCLLPPSPRDIWFNKGKIEPPYDNIAFSRRTFDGGWSNCLEILDTWIKKATSKI